MGCKIPKQRQALLDKYDIGGSSPLLFRAMGERTGYLLQGGKGERMVVAIPDPENGTVTIAEDIPAADNTVFSRSEEYCEICMSASAFRKLIDIIVETSGLELVSKRNKGGRPSRYSMEDARRIAGLRKDGMSIRAIAQKEKMSTTTVQKLIREYESIGILEGLGSRN